MFVREGVGGGKCGGSRYIQCKHESVTSETHSVLH